MDVIQRLEPVIIEIERERECVVVVAHQAILRALYGYFMKIPLSVRFVTGALLWLAWPDDARCWAVLAVVKLHVSKLFSVLERRASCVS